jgi:hypothetical protein
MVPLKKTHTSKPFKELDNMINTSVKTPSVPRRDGKRLAPNVVTPKSNAPSGCTDICKHEADILYGIMKARFASLLNSRLLDRQMHSHECVVFVRWNLSRLAAILILSRQVQDDLATTAEDDTLL